MALESFSISRMRPRNQLILFSLLALGIAAVFFQYYVGPLRTEVLAQDTRIEGLKAEVAEAEKVKQRLPEFKAEVRRQQARLAQLKQVLPGEKETALIIRRIQELAVESSLRITSFTPQKTVANDFYDDWPILISIEGNYNSLGLFFEHVSQFTRVINIEDLNIKGLDKNSRSRTIGVTCTATTFVFREEDTNNEKQVRDNRKNVAARF